MFLGRFFWGKNLQISNKKSHNLLRKQFGGANLPLGKFRNSPGEGKFGKMAAGVPKFLKLKQNNTVTIHWVWPPHRIPVTTRIITFLVGDPNLNLHFPLLLGGGHIQTIHTKYVSLRIRLYVLRVRDYPEPILF